MRSTYSQCHPDFKVCVASFLGFKLYPLIVAGPTVGMFWTRYTHFMYNWHCATQHTFTDQKYLWRRHGVAWSINTEGRETRRQVVMLLNENILIWKSKSCLISYKFDTKIDKNHALTETCLQQGKRRIEIGLNFLLCFFWWSLNLYSRFYSYTGSGVRKTPS